MKHPIVISATGKTIRFIKYRSDRYIYVPLEVPITNKLWTEWTEHYMNNKTNPDPTTTTSTTAGATPEDFKDTNLKYSLSKFEYDLYHEEDDIAEQVIRVKRVSMPNKEEKWKVMSDNKLIFTIESPKISKKEREFLQTIDGFNFILSQAKIGIKSLNGFRNELKSKLEQQAVVDKAATSKTKKPKKKSK